MAGKGSHFIIHGSFTKKSDAVKKERAGRHRFIKVTHVRGHRRYTVLEPLNRKG